MPHKMGFSIQHYKQCKPFTGKGWLVILQIAAIIFTLILVIRVFPLALAAGLCLAGTLTIFIFTYPVNQIMCNWTIVPRNW
jgi:hypothetical protein